MVRKYKFETVKPAAPKSVVKEGKIKTPIMHLKLNVGSEEKTFDSPVAEEILRKVRAVTVGQDQIEYWDKATNTIKSFTYCCGDKFEITYTNKETTLQTTEVDCYKLPVTYQGDK